MARQSGHDTYPECRNCPQPHIEDSAEMEAYALSKSTSILPLFEKIISDNKQVQALSLETNQLLQCRWRSYIKNAGDRIFEPCQFPRIDNLHIHKYTVKFMESLTPKNWPNKRKKLSVGPGVDLYGQKPIPDDMHVCKRNAVTSTKAKKQ